MKILAELFAFFLIAAIKFISASPLVVYGSAGRDVAKHLYLPGVRPCFKDGNCPPGLTCDPEGPKSICIQLSQLLDAQKDPKIAVQDAGCGGKNCPEDWVCALLNGIHTCLKPRSAREFMPKTIESQPAEIFAANQVNHGRKEESDIEHEYSFARDGRSHKRLRDLTSGTLSNSLRELARTGGPPLKVPSTKPDVFAGVNREAFVQLVRFVTPLLIATTHPAAAHHTIMLILRVLTPYRQHVIPVDLLIQISMYRREAVRLTLKPITLHSFTVPNVADITLVLQATGAIQICGPG
ncbi:MAG: hypothetical protein Q9160_008020 [Pyrenula sp. 1 TL-2023]